MFNIDSISFRTLNDYDEGFIKLDYIDGILKSEGWKKVYDGSEDPGWSGGNFDVIYVNGNYEVVLTCDEDAYVFRITLNKNDGKGE